MYISKHKYQWLARFFGVVLMLYGGGALWTYANYLISGVNGFSEFTNGMGMLFLSLMGAMCFPMGVAMIVKAEAAQLLLVLTSIFFALNALIRLSILASPEILQLAGSATPIGEFIVFALLSILAISFRPRKA